MKPLDKLLKQSMAQMESMQKWHESGILKAYKEALIEIRGEMAGMYKKWAVDKKLTLAEMSKYNRYTAMEKKIMEILDGKTKEVVSKIKKIPPEQYNEAFYRTAWAVDNSVGVRLNWGMLNPTNVAKLFSLADLKNKHYQEALKNYPQDAKKAIRQALIGNLSQGKSFESMTKDLQKAIGVTAKKGIQIVRTEAMTAINAGTDYAFQKAKEKGVQGKIVWVATLDGKTRPSHQAMDGVAKDEDGMYHGEIEAPYPGWEGLDASDRINCRCTERFEIEGYSPQLRRTREQGVIPYETYEHWKDGRTKALEPRPIKESEKSPEEIYKDFGDSLTFRDVSLGGSTGARLAVDPDGKEWVVKQYLKASSPEDSVANEYIASKIYDMVGMHAPESRLAIIDGKYAFATRKIEGKILGESQIDDTIKQKIKNSFVTDAYLANWDSFGMSNDNILISGGMPYHIDLGGSLLFRAQGALKKGFNIIVDEIDTLRDHNINPSAAGWYSKITNQEIYNQIKILQSRVNFQQIEKIIDSTKLNPELATKLKSVLFGRMDYLEKYAQKLTVEIIKDQEKTLLEIKNKKEKAKKNTELYKKLQQAQKEGKPVTGFDVSKQPIVKVKATDDRSNVMAGKEEIHKALLKMSSEERSALHKFTGAYSGTMNEKAYKYGDPDKALESAIQKLPRASCNISRKMGASKKLVEQFNKYETGKWEEAEWKAFSSTSYDLSVWNGGMRFYIVNDGTNLDAGLIGSESANPSECEVLVNHGARFKVIGVAKDEESKLYGVLLRPKAPWESSGMSQEPPKKYTIKELEKIVLDDEKVYF